MEVIIGQYYLCDSNHAGSEGVIYFGHDILSDQPITAKQLRNCQNSEKITKACNEAKILKIVDSNRLTKYI